MGGGPLKKISTFILLIVSFVLAQEERAVHICNYGDNIILHTIQELHLV